MVPLATNKQILMLLCVFPVDNSINRPRKIFYKLFTLIVLVIILGTLASTTIFFRKNVSINLEASLYVLFQIFATYGMLDAIIIILASPHKIADIFKKLQAICDKNKNEDSLQFLTQANDKSEKLWYIYIKFVMTGNVISSLILSSMSVLYSWKKCGHFDAKYAYKPFKTITPWNQQELFGYFIEICFENISLQSFFISSGSLILLFVSICFYHQSFYKIFRNSVNKMEIKQNQNNTVALRDLIESQNLFKDWFLFTAKVFSPFIVVQLATGAMMLACSIFQLDLEFQHFDVNICILLMGAFYASANLFLFCFFGKSATESFEKMSDCLFEWNWYAHSVDLQKCFILMIQNAQIPISYYGFGLELLNLGTFTQLIKSVYSYYMIFKSLTSE